jgi:hypothetical protein
MNAISFSSLCLFVLIMLLLSGLISWISLLINDLPQIYTSDVGWFDYVMIDN